MTGRSSTRNF